MKEGKEESQKIVIIEQIITENNRALSPEKYQEVVNTSQSYPSRGKKELALLHTILVSDLFRAASRVRWGEG